MTNKNPKVIKRKTQFYSLEGPGTYQNLRKRLLRKELLLPEGDRIASLVYDAYDSEEKESQEIQDIVKYNYIWVFNRNLWIPEGVYVVKDPNAIGTIEELNKKYLCEQLNRNGSSKSVLYSNKGDIAFAPRGAYKPGKHTPESLAKDGFVIASFGEEGAKKLGELSKKFNHKPIIYGIEPSFGEEVQSVSSLSSNWEGGGFCISGDSSDTYFCVPEDSEHYDYFFTSRDGSDSENSGFAFGV